MPPTLEAMLAGLPDHHLRRTVADRWDLDLPATDDRDALVASMLDAMRSPDRIERVVDRLYGDLRRVLYHLALADGASTASRVSEDVFDGDLWRTKQSLEELRNYQLVFLEETGSLQGAYPEYEARIPEDLRDPLVEVLGLVPVDDDRLDADEPPTIQRAGWEALRDAVVVLVRARDVRLGRTQAGDLRKRAVDRLGDAVTDPDPARLELIVGGLERLGLLVPEGQRLEPVDAAVDAFLAQGPARAQALLLAGAADRQVPGTSARIGDLLWTVTALAELSPGWKDADAALGRVRHEGLRRDLRTWFARSLHRARAFLDTVGHWFGLVDLGDGALRLTPLARALVGLEDPPEAEPVRVVVDPSLEVHLFQDPPDPRRLADLLRFAEVDHLGPASRFRLTREALWEGLEDDLVLEDVLEVLGDVPDNVGTTLEEWAERYESVDLERAWLLSVRDPDLLDDLLDEETFASGVDRLGPRHARLVDPDVVDRLEEAGLMARPSGFDPREDDAPAGAPELRFQEALEDLADGLEVGLPGWLEGGPRFEAWESF